MFEIFGQFHTSLTDRSSIHLGADLIIHLETIISSPSINGFTPWSELPKFHIELQSNSLAIPHLMCEGGSQVCFIGQLGLGVIGGYPTINVPLGMWGVHKNGSERLENSFHQARVIGSGYVVEVVVQPNSLHRSYVMVVVPALKKVSGLILVDGVFKIIGLMLWCASGVNDLPQTLAL